MPTPKIHIIGLCGFAGAGKDTVADLLVTHAGFRKLAFADALKAELEKAFQVEPMVFTRPEFKSCPMPELALTRCIDNGYVGAAIRHLVTADPAPRINEELVLPRTPRQTMQLWGTEYRRAHDARYWTRIIISRINHYATTLHERHFVITDCRFPNEVDTLRSMGGLLWQVRRPNLTAATTAEGTHSSATDGSAFEPDAVINNAHDIRHLQQVVLGEFWALDAGLEKVTVEIEA